jgi:hypothetical protein
MKFPTNNLSMDKSVLIILYSMKWKAQKGCFYHALNITLSEKKMNTMISLSLVEHLVNKIELVVVVLEYSFNSSSLTLLK